MGGWERVTGRGVGGREFIRPAGFVVVWDFLIHDCPPSMGTTRF